MKWTMDSERFHIQFFLWSIAFCCLITFFSFHMCYVVPPPQEYDYDHFSEFSELRARRFLQHIENLGPKVVGTSTNDVGAPALILTELFKSTINKHQKSMPSIKFLSGLSLPLKIYSRPLAEQLGVFSKQSSFFNSTTAFHEGMVADQPGCFCRLSNIDISSELYSRFKELAAFCAPSALLLPHLPPSSWVFRLRELLQISLKTGCKAREDWIQADIFLRYLKSMSDSNIITTTLSKFYNNDIAIRSSFEPNLKKSVDSYTYYMADLQNVLSDTVASFNYLMSLTELTDRGFCKDESSLLGCSNNAVYPVERLVAAWSESYNDAVVLDVSLSHHYNGNFVVEIPKGAHLANIYQNLTNFAVRVAPLKLMMNKTQRKKQMKTLHNLSFELVSSMRRELELMDHLPQTVDIKNHVDYAINHYNKVTTADNNAFKYITHHNESGAFYSLPYGFPGAFALASHFDSAIGSPGAADAGVGVTIIMETFRNVLAAAGENLRKIISTSRLPWEIRRPLVIILNGGEENVLPAAHGFIHLHPWTATITEIINLEAAGNWGREYLLRAGNHSDKYMTMYKSTVDSPHALSVIQQLFEGGLIPGLTDFQFYRDIGMMEGFDLALGSGGYFYHSKLDKLENIPPGTIQHFGNTVTALTLAFLAEHFPHETSPEAFKLERSKTVESSNAFFDVFGQYLIIIPSLLFFSKLWVIFFLVCIFYWLSMINYKSQGQQSISKKTAEDASTIDGYTPVTTTDDTATTDITTDATTTEEKKSGLLQRRDTHEQSGNNTSSLAKEQNVMLNNSEVNNNTTDTKKDVSKTSFVKIVCMQLKSEKLLGVLLSSMCIVLALLIAGALNTAAAWVFSMLGLGMRWLEDPVRIPFLYSPIPLLILYETPQYFYRWRSQYPSHVLQQEMFLTVDLLYSISYIFAALNKSPFALAPFLLLCCLNIGRYIGEWCKQQFSKNPNKDDSFFVSLGILMGQLGGFLLVVNHYAALMDHLGPVFGRIALTYKADIIVSLITTLAVFTLCPLLIIIPSIRLTRHPETAAILRRAFLCFFLPFAWSFVLSHPTFVRAIPKRLDVVHFTSRHYNGTSSIPIRTESGITLQGLDGLGVPLRIRQKFEEALNPYWLPPSHPSLSVTPVSFFSSESNLQQYSPDQSHLRHFSVPSTPKQAYWRFPQGSIFRRVADPFIYVYPDISPALVLPDGDSDFSSSNNTTKDSKSWRFVDDFNLVPTSNIYYSDRHVMPSLSWKILHIKDSISNSLKRIQLTVRGPSKMIIMIPAEQPIIRWSLSEALPERRSECECYAAMFGAGVAEPTGYSFSVDYDASQHTVSTIIISGNYFDISTPVLQKIQQLEEQLNEKGPDFVTITASVGELGIWHIPLSP